MVRKDLKPGRFGGFEIKDLNVPKKNVFYFPPRSQRYSDYLLHIF